MTPLRAMATTATQLFSEFEGFAFCVFDMCMKPAWNKLGSTGSVTQLNLNRNWSRDVRVRIVVDQIKVFELKIKNRIALIENPNRGEMARFT